MIPAQIVIGDDLRFRADEVKAARSPYSYLPEALLTFELLHAADRTVVASGNMTIYDVPTASFEGSVSKTLLGVYNENDETGLRPLENYVLRVFVSSAGVRTTKAVELVAVLDPDSSFEASVT